MARNPNASFKELLTACNLLGYRLEYDKGIERYIVSDTDGKQIEHCSAEEIGPVIDALYQWWAGLSSAVDSQLGVVPAAE